MIKIFHLLLFIGLSFPITINSQTKNVKKVVLQGFWWDYKNDNFANSWSNYITELAPRLKQIGIDVLWIPPISKGSSGTFDVGYGVYDHYDLGDKYQKGTVQTRMGTKDELLRMIAVLHANGIEVLQDLVPNQLNGAGDLSNGGIDPLANTNNKYKNFRYTSYEKPAATGTLSNTESINDYLNRNGRFPKNWQNFHNNPAHNGCESTNGDNWCQELFGPDVCYYDNAFGQSSNAIYNPIQTGGANNGYMRRGMRDWMVWLKKQTGFDALRLDACKHYENAASEDWLYNLQHNAGFANGSDSMISVGEYVGSASEQDSWCNTVQNRSGTFDFSFRSGIKDMVDAGGFYNMANLPGTQQNNRTQYYSNIAANVHRTMPFVNNHDTYRPITDALGNITGWNTGSELAPHIDPINNSRLALAYASIFAIDGNPQIFFEDIFNIFNTSKRNNHLPTSITDLPANTALLNIINCHQKLQFKNGVYKVRSTVSGGNVFFNSGSLANDLLIIERSGKALIGLNDRGDASGWQSAYVDSDFPPGTILKDYSGANGTTTYTVPADKRVNVNTPPVDPANNRWGYSIWAPIGFDETSYVPTRIKRTTQEWEMANDLGDSHCSALGYGGALPNNSSNQRVVGKIFVEANQNIVAQISNATNASNIILSIWDLNGNKLAESNGAVTLNYLPTVQGWLTIKIRNINTTVTGQNVWIKVDYQAPQIVNTRDANTQQTNTVAIWTGNRNTTDISDCGNWEEAKMPNANTNVIIPANAFPFPIINTNLSVKNITIENGASLQVTSGTTLSVLGDWVNNNTVPLNVCGTVSFEGSATQQLLGQNNFCTLKINNSNSVNALNNNWVTNQLVLLLGNFILNDYNLTLQSGCTILGGSPTSYVNCKNTTTGGFLYQEINGINKLFPIGNNNYTPLNIINNGTTQQCRVRCFEDVLENGLSGSSLPSTEKIKKTWEITPVATGAIADITFNWNSINNDLMFNSSISYVTKNLGGTGNTWQQISSPSAANGSNPFNKTATAISSFSKFSIFSNAAVLPVTILEFKGNVNGNTAILKFKITATSLIKSYQILKSIDGISFQKIGDGISNINNSYTFIDVAFQESAFYKLAFTEENGAMVYSNIIFLKKANEIKNILVYPNPITTNVKFNAIGFSTNEKIILQLFTSEGKKLLEIKNNINTIEQVLNTKLINLTSGIYFFKLSTSTFNQFYKLIK